MSLISRCLNVINSNQRLVTRMIAINHSYNSSPQLFQQTRGSPYDGSFVRHVNIRSSPKDDKAEIHSIIRHTEKPLGNADKHEFQAETRKLLDIVACSLYSEREVFVRELISNASDALEKFRYAILTGGEQELGYEATDRALEIHIATDKQGMQLTIQDTGVGMTREELVSNLGTIARSGSKQFLEQIQNRKKSGGAESTSNIIGQFGVGFYSAFMVANKVEVFTRSSIKDSSGWHWQCEGAGMYEIQEAEGVSIGTKIVIHLRSDCREYADEDRIKSIIKKYSNFVGSPIYLNGKRANDIKPIWLMEPKDVNQEQHIDFYRFIANTFDTPRFVLHYKTDAPINICALLYFSGSKPGLFELTRERDVGVALYSRKILIQAKSDNLVPKWLRFIKGVVDSEDIPLNLSRELLQNSALIKKLSKVITSRVLRYLQERAKKQPEEFESFYRDYSIFLKEGIVTSDNHSDREEVAKLLRFDSSSTYDGKRISLDDYCSDVGDQKDIYYLAAPNRALAETSPYYENLKKRNIQVLFCYEPYDEMVLMQLGSFKNKNIVSVEKAMRQDKTANNTPELNKDNIFQQQSNDLVSWIKEKLTGKVANVIVTDRLETHPCVITVEDMASARHFIRTQSHQMSDENRFQLLQPQLEINPKHELMKKLNTLRESDPALAELLTEQLFSNAVVGAGLAEDPRMLLTNINDLLMKALEKH